MKRASAKPFALGRAALVGATLVLACDGQTSSHDAPAAGPPPRGGGDARGLPPAAGSPRPISVPSGGVDATAPTSAPAEPALHFVGRFDARDPAGPKCAWPGCSIVARFEGTHVSVRLAEQLLTDGPSEWDVAVDGTTTKKLVLEDGPHDYELADGLAPGAHTVEITKRNEAQTGITQLLGFDFQGGKLLAPPPAAARRIEVIGDSTAAGYGIEGPGPDCPGSNGAARYANFLDTWGARLGKMFDAEVHGVAYSGKGVYQNIWRPDKDTMGVLYPRSNPLDPSSTYDFSTWVPDIVMVWLGANDFGHGQPVDNGPAPVDGFSSKLDELVAMVRARASNAHVFLVVSPGGDSPDERERHDMLVSGMRAVTDKRNAGGDARVYFVAPPMATPDERTGCRGHGNISFHARVAPELAIEITNRTGWTSR